MLMKKSIFILMSNISSLYNELGFSYSSIHSATRAVEYDPLNAAAYRRLFFSNVFTTHTRPMHQQSMETEKLLAKMLAPPTLNSIIFTPAGLSPYQQMFVNSGIDTVVSGNYVRRETKNSNLDVYTGYFSMAGKPDYPAAMSVALMPARQISDTGSSSQNYLTSSESELGNYNTLTIIKCRVSPAMELFAELTTDNIARNMNSLSKSENSSVIDLGSYGSYFTDTISQAKLTASTDSENHVPILCPKQFPIQ